MSATTQNNATELIETDNIELVKKTSAPAKNRASYITEAFEAIAKVEDFPLTIDELWEYFEKATKHKNIKIRKLSEKKPEKTAEKGPKRLSGYNLFTKEFKEKGPEGVGVMTHKAAAWKALSKEEQAVWNEQATETNKSNGYEPKAKKLAHNQLMEAHNQLMEAYYPKFEKWAQDDPKTRGEKPERPERPQKKKRAKKADTSSDTSEMSD
jgi:hypothetical protein